jgi:hypothetical protein
MLSFVCFERMLEARTTVQITIGSREANDRICFSAAIGLYIAFSFVPYTTFHQFSLYLLSATEPPCILERLLIGKQ